MNTNQWNAKDVLARKRAVKTLAAFLVLIAFLSGCVYAVAWWRGGISQYAASLMFMPFGARLAMWL